MRQFNEKILLRVTNALVTKRTKIGVIILEISHAEYRDVMCVFFSGRFFFKTSYWTFSLCSLSPVVDVTYIFSCEYNDDAFKSTTSFELLRQCEFL